MSLSFSAEPDARQIAEAVRHVARRRFLPARLLALPLLVIGMTGYFGFGLSFLALLAVLALIFSVLGPEVVIRRMTREGVRLLARPTLYHFDDDRFGFATDLARTEAVWELLSAYDELPGLMVVRLGKEQFFLIPTAGLEEDRLMELRDLLDGAVFRARNRPGRPASPGGQG
ncbi:YcxB family protein [Nucisporomicrobium flavum]|uniref:YcxB family protein n=1 Tax=Nucisporomicrobium flavum TaxID=2785915 RepID=UPI0018F2C16A|nr:YcxB family protein [Nucisporomicrobium flavum]